MATAYSLTCLRMNETQGHKIDNYIIQLFFSRFEFMNFDIQFSNSTSLNDNLQREHSFFFQSIFSEFNTMAT